MTTNHVVGGSNPSWRAICLFKLDKAKFLMTWGYFLKVNMLILAFVLVVLSIYRLRVGGIPNSVEALLGLEPQIPVSLEEDSPLTELSRGVGRFFWCRTRVSELEFPSGERLVQEGRRWFWQVEESRRELPPVQVEKWFGDFCTLEVKRLESSPVLTQDMGLWLKVHFIRGEPKSFYYNPQLEAFLFDGQFFMSPQFVEATQDLLSLAL